MKKKSLIYVMLLSFCVTLQGQIKVTNNGNVGIGTNDPQTKLQINDGECLLNSNTGAWGRTIWVKVHNSKACAYHLWSVPQDRDVFSVCEEGWLYSISGGYCGSDISLKKNIQSIQKPLQIISKLNGVKYQYKNSDNYRFGFIAQEMEKVLPEIVKEMPDSTKAISYDDIIAITVEAIKEQQKEIEQLKKTIEELKLSSSVSESKKTTIKQERFGTESSAFLFQNKPNPFSIDTEIEYTLPKEFINAKIVIYDLQGKEIKSYELSKDSSKLTLRGSEFPAGMYIYGLMIDNTLIDSKRMVLTK